MTILEHSYIYRDHCENYHDYHIMAIFSRGALIIGSAIGNTLCLLIFVSVTSLLLIKFWVVKWWPPYRTSVIAIVPR